MHTVNYRLSTTRPPIFLGEKRVPVETRLAASYWVDKGKGEIQSESHMERPRVRSIVLVLAVLAGAWGGTWPPRPHRGMALASSARHCD